MDIAKMFKEFLALSDALRQGYTQSLSGRKSEWRNNCYFAGGDIPEIFQVIYDTVSGTIRETTEQRLMDFIPGFRLIYIDELGREKECLDGMLKHFDISDIKHVLPLLANYSSDYICFLETADGKECIGLAAHDSLGIAILHNSAEKFLRTVCEFYKQGVYFLDKDGYLDSDYEKESVIGRELNGDVAYWHE